MRKPYLILAALIPCLLLNGFPANADSTRQITVSNTEELMQALENAQAGDEIILNAGTYQNDKWTGKWAAFWSEASGTPENHIILRSADPKHPAEIRGETIEKKYALDIIGSYWEIRDLRICSAAKGMFLEKSEHSIISGCEICNTGDEGLHIIDNSSYNLVEGCYFHDTGKLNAKYGEGVYIGSAKSATGYGFECHYNTVRGCKFGPNLTADHVDIKEYTRGNLVEYCTFDGTGIQGENGGDSFVEIKGNDAVVRYNTGFRNGCEKQLYGFDLSQQLDGWGLNAKIYDNTLFLDSEDVYTVKGWNCSAQIFRNTTEPAECTANGNKIMQVRSISRKGDANEEGAVNREDAETLLTSLLSGSVRHISGENADIDKNGSLNAADLTLLKRMLISGDTENSSRISLEFIKEDAGKWRMTDGLGGRTVSFCLSAEPDSVLNLAWGYWDPAAVNADTGKQGKWINVPVGRHTADADGKAAISAEIPADCTRVALEIWDYDAPSGASADSVVLSDVYTESNE